MRRAGSALAINDYDIKKADFLTPSLPSVVKCFRVKSQQTRRPEQAHVIEPAA
jgi:hypothetical protein